MHHTQPDTETVLILGATKIESNLLIDELACTQRDPLLDFAVFASQNHRIIVVQCGVGMANASAAAALAITTFRPVRVYNTGICGIYSDRSDRILSPVAGTGAVFADTGKETDAGFLTPDRMGLSLFTPEKETGTFNPVPLYSDDIPGEIERAVFLTVSCCSGSTAQAQTYQSRFDFNENMLCCEDMESAAIALICCRAGLPCSVLRGVSNRCGTAALDPLTIKKAARTAQETLLNIL